MLLSVPSLLILGALSPTLVLGLPSWLNPYDNDFIYPRDSAAILSNLTSDQICGTKQPSPALREVHAALREDPGVLPRLVQRSDPRPHIGKRQVNDPKVQVEVFIHWVTTFDQARFYTQNVRGDVIKNQVSKQA